MNLYGVTVNMNLYGAGYVAHLCQPKFDFLLPHASGCWWRTSKTPVVSPISTQWRKTAGPSCSKLMMSLVNVSKFQTLISNTLQYFSTKNISVFGYKLVKHLS